MVIHDGRKTLLFGVTGRLDTQGHEHAAQFLGRRVRQQPGERRVQSQRSLPGLPQRRRHMQKPLAVRPDQSVIGQCPEGLVQPASTFRSGHTQQIAQSST